MKLTIRLIALTVACLGIGATLAAQPPKKLTGKWQMGITVPDMPDISAFSICEASGDLLQISYEREFPGILAIGAGTSTSRSLNMAPACGQIHSAGFPRLGASCVQVVSWCSSPTRS